MINTNKLSGFFTFLFFTLLFSFIGLINHYFFRTYALDLGLYTNALYKYAHFILADCSLFKSGNDVLLSDHFDLHLVIFSPLVYLFGTYTLLIIQIIFILIGGIGVYKFILYTSNGNESMAKFAMVYFLSFFGIYAALSFDYHSNVVAAMVIPWFILFLKQNKFKQATFAFVFILLAKENMALWLLFICLGLLFERKKNIGQTKVLLALMFLSILYFLIIVGYIMPKLSNSGVYEGFKYSVLGDSPSNALMNLLSHPIKFLKLLFVSHATNPSLIGVKLELHLFVLVSGLYLLVIKPQFLLMLIPIYMQKMYHNDSRMWGIGGQYSIEFAPILALGVFSVISDFKSEKTKVILKYLLVISSIGVTIRSMDQTFTYTKKSQIRFYQISHYTNDFDVVEAHRVLQLIPKDAKVSALSYFVPHLALREKIYQFPIVNDADYIVFNYCANYYPLNSVQFIEEIKKYTNSNNWVYFFQSNEIAILKRK